MTAVSYVLIRFFMLFLEVLLLAMFVRAVMSWFFMGQENRLMSFLCLVTEPVIMPVRRLCDRFGWFNGVPFDMPYLITTLLLSLIVAILEGALL